MVEGENILRRYFVMNGFDGALTAFGIILGSWIAQNFSDPKTLLFAGIGASFAMGVSGFTIAYLTERAERTREIKELEEHMIADLNDTHVTRASFWTSLVVSFVDGLSPFLFSLGAMIPFFFVYVGLEMLIAYIISTAIVGVEVIVLGLFLGAVSKENKIMYAIKILPAALIVAGLTYLLELISRIGGG
jgi:predicted membrane protein (TIGR00267 family)